MILSTNLSPAFLTLLDLEEVPISAIEVGPWYSPEAVQNYQNQLIGWEFYFHPGNWTSSMALSNEWMKRLNAYLKITKSPWASVHITMLPHGYVELGRRFGIYLPLPPGRRNTDWYVERVKRLQAGIDVPVILENMPSFPTKKYLFETDPEFICRILAETQCQFLLDIGHARVVATVCDIPVRNYLAQLPLDKVVQIHVSGPRERDGVLFDAHEPLTPVDYELLAWVLERTRPQVLTLEYFKDKDQLRAQLVQLARMIE